ncbi:hypothetical protein BZA05DRAFT_420639 [Tricharina praecox]|uniref:uncharacterized protein n=1 Tax=Tricharina praecox TaxID=43433 RepID=UPI00221F20AF|nr:uncharacterized protein BZA05DRAFT_420639 [Tricharina praecox]KAI5847592.1 hypothetical protein BZA05DRAFT_420639 [Tricharina praecox]
MSLPDMCPKFHQPNLVQSLVRFLSRSYSFRSSSWINKNILRRKVLNHQQRHRIRRKDDFKLLTPVQQKAPAMSDNDTDSDNQFVRYQEEAEDFAAVSQNQTRICRGMGTEVKESIEEYVDTFQEVLSTFQGMVGANDTEKCLVLQWNAFKSELLRIMGEKICVALDDTRSDLYKESKLRDLDQKTVDVQEQIRKIEKQLELIRTSKKQEKEENQEHPPKEKEQVENYEQPPTEEQENVDNSGQPLAEDVKNL